MKTSHLQKVLFGLITIIFILTACSGGPATTSNNVIPTATSTSEPPSSEWLAMLGYPSPEIPRISSQQLKQMMDNEEPLIIIDNRNEYDFSNGHIPQAINLPDFLEAEQIAGFLTLPRDIPIIFYCWPTESRSAVSADRLLKLDAGFDPANILILWKGYDEWQNLGYPTVITTPTTTGVPQPPSPEELAVWGFLFPELPRLTCEQLKQMIDEAEPLVVVDTRSEFFFSSAHIQQSVNIPYQMVEEHNASLLALPKDRPIIFYCDWPDDSKSAILADGLLKLDAGFNPENVLVLWQGYSRWLELDYPVDSTQITTTTSEPSTPTSTAAEIYTVTATEASAIPTDTNTEQIRMAVIDLDVRDYIPSGDPVPILITITNPQDSQWTCDIPITFTNQGVDNDVRVWMINVTLEVGEARVILVKGITMYPIETAWKVRVGIKSTIVGSGWWAGR